MKKGKGCTLFPMKITLKSRDAGVYRCEASRSYDTYRGRYEKSVLKKNIYIYIYIDSYGYRGSYDRSEDIYMEVSGYILEHQ